MINNISFGSSNRAFDIDNQILDCGKNGYIYFNYADIFELKSRGIFRDNEFFSVYDKNTKRKMKANFSPGSELYSVKFNLFYDSQVFIK